jgi:pantoate--beta-alanine ligase
MVATQGNLHAGQVSLIVAARDRADVVVAAIAPNPLELGANDAPRALPGSPSADLALAASAGADVAFAPPQELLLPPGHSTYVEETARSRRLCGVSRPNHFRGFLTHFLKLVHCTGPDTVLFGHKDLQQAAVVRQAARDLFLDLEIVVCPTVRETDGLPVNWRNSRLTPAQRADAAALPVALESARQLVVQGARSVDRVVAEVTHALRARRMLRVIYVHCVDPETMEPAREVIPGRTVLAASVWVEETRLLDNCVL